MSKNRRPCPCGSGKPMRRCCGQPSSAAKLDLERSARALAERGSHAEAAAALVRRAQLSPNNPMIWNDLGVESIAAGQPEAAHAAFLRAHQTFPDYPLPLYNLARLAFAHCLAAQAAQPDEARRFALEAIGYLNDCLRYDPLLAPAHALLVHAHDVLAWGATGEALRPAPPFLASSGEPFSRVPHS